MTPDPYSDSADSSDPQSWNRYAYTSGDPVNANDPEGLFPVDRRLPLRGSSLLPSTPVSPVVWRQPSSLAPDVDVPDPTSGGGGDDPGPDPSDPGYCPPSERSCGGDPGSPGSPGTGSSGGGGSTGSGSSGPAVSIGVMEGLQSAGVINGWSMTATGWDVSFTPAEAAAAGICLADPVCAVPVGGLITIYVAYTYGPALVQAIESAYKASQISDANRIACEKQYEAEARVCRSLPTARERSSCWRRASEVYGNCLAGRDVPPHY